MPHVYTSYTTAEQLLTEIERRGATRLAGGSDIAAIRSAVLPFLEPDVGWHIHDDRPNRWTAVELNPDGSESDRCVHFAAGPRGPVQWPHEEQTDIGNIESMSVWLFLSQKGFSPTDCGGR